MVCYCCNSDCRFVERYIVHNCSLVWGKQISLVCVLHCASELLVSIKILCCFFKCSDVLTVNVMGSIPEAI